MAIVSKLYDITSLIERYASIQVVNKAVVRGIRELHSNCPWCGGHDRFISRPETGQYTCATRASGCGRHGDGVNFLVEYVGMSVREAMTELGIDEFSAHKRAAPIPAKSSRETPPNKNWQESGLNLLGYAEKALWNTSGGKEMLNYLRGRGLNDDTIKRKRFGYIPPRKDGNWYIGSFEDWGFDVARLTPEVKAKKGVRIPPGILIPWLSADELWRLSIKRPDQPKGKDSGQVLGSGEGLYNVDLVRYDQPAMLVESEICACSVEQEAGDLINCVATGSVSRGRLLRWIAKLTLASFVLQGYDEDEAGYEGAAYWLKALKHSYRWSPTIAKDPNDILRQQHNKAARYTLRQWVESGIASVPQELVAEAAPVAIKSVEVAPQEPPVIQSVEPDTPMDRETELLITANTVSQIIDIFGGPENVKWTMREPGAPLEIPYYPVTLSQLPRKICPHVHLRERRISANVIRPVARQCPNRPLACGWCEEHATSHELLCLLSKLAYPALELGARGIEAGVANAEWYACLVSHKHATEDIRRLKARFSLAPA
ncbi:hypothetical protein KDA_65240 [Dictyobacter alpinus]|uniref:Zinc finger CHC2-type domain-containing protein n=1 Tax=Dictyobacter alpinus TaxID=2014873 RepID=A0A402BI88_9CHLR|nr:hypothetical protein [Dictyobacter alpinus]GCE31040.1 hypothetical protein KDA_65240 [Dictyobacter alpinus]